MYAISFGENYLFLKYFSSRKEGEEWIKDNVMNLIYEICYNKKPEVIVIKNNELKNFFDKHQDIVVEIEKTAKIDNLVSGNCFSFQMKPKLMKDFIILKNHYAGTKREFDVPVLLKLAKEGYANKVNKN